MEIPDAALASILRVNEPFLDERKLTPRLDGPFYDLFAMCKDIYITSYPQ